LRPPDIRILRTRTEQYLQAFERGGKEADIAMESLRPAHYVLCASIDDVVVNTPWGAASPWATRTLVATFHPHARGTDEVFDQLQNMEKTPGRFVANIELIYLCLSLGLMGRYRQTGGATELEQIRAAAYAVITAQREAADEALSPRWRGVAAAYQPAKRSLPVWLALVIAVAVCGGLLFWTSVSLNAASDDVQAQVLATPPTHMPQVTRAVLHSLPPPPAPAEPSLLDRLRASLQPDIAAGAVDLVGTSVTPIIRLPDRVLFAPGSAVVRTASLPLLERVTGVLPHDGATVRVIDYTDDQPVRTVRFPSVFQLSIARANAVRAIVAGKLAGPTQLTAEGRADADPIASNATADGREQNGRVEIVVSRRE
jgi:type VI secretion system protein ImpK